MEIWRSEKVKEIRRGLNHGYSEFCLDCGLKKLLPEGQNPRERAVEQEILPRIFFEPTVLCNLSCYNSVCCKESGIMQTRSQLQFPFTEFQRIIDDAGKNLIRLDFFNYGESFCHPQAVEMIEYIKAKFPHIFLYTSTNGLMLNEEKSRRIIQSGLDEITFSVDGADASTYVHYRRNGKFEKLLKIMKGFIELRNETGREVPFINWRYILFRWNDSWWKMHHARKMAERIGVDRLTWEITDHPPDAYSRKYIPGSKAWKKIYYEIWDVSHIGSAIKSKRYLSKIQISMPEIKTGVNTSAKVPVRIKNIGGVPWLHITYSGRWLVRLGAQLYSDKKQLIELNYARATLQQHLKPGETGLLEIELPPLLQPGLYWLKFDMVAEGVDWFENGGSNPLWKRYYVG